MWYRWDEGDGTSSIKMQGARPKVHGAVNAGGSSKGAGAGGAAVQAEGAGGGWRRGPPSLAARHCAGCPSGSPIPLLVPPTHVADGLWTA